MDHSKYHNPEKPVGYVKIKPRLNYEEEIEIDGVLYKIVPCILDSDLFQLQDCSSLSDFELTDTEQTEKQNVKSPSRKCTESFSSSSENETTDNDSIEEIDRVVKCGKRAYEHFHISGLHTEKEKEIKNKAKRMKKDDVYIISESSSLSSSHSKHREQLSQSPTISIHQYNDINVDGESLKPPAHLFGHYFCEVCKVEMSSSKVYHDHLNGKRHIKNLKLKNVAQAVFQAIPPTAATEGQSKYPKPPHGVIRRKMKSRAKIQDVIKGEVKKPCPGLHLVTEIQGLRETTYYCSICNSVCSSSSIISHLIGFKHQLNTLKYFKPGDYEMISFERKNLIQDRIVSMLRAIQKKEGLGRMAVEVEELVSEDRSFNVSKPRTSRHEWGTSMKDSGMSFVEYYDKATIPNKSSADYFCKYCDAHMNCEDMWKAHIYGKRHITNLKKLPGDRPSKTKTIPLPNVTAKLLNRLKDECRNEPIVGLGDVREVQIKETNSESYHCFLCGSCHTSMDIIEHLVSYKHRINYLDYIDYPYIMFISGMSELSSIPVVRRICAEVEDEYGCGTPSVHMNKSALYG